MKNFVILSLAIFLSFGCNGATQQANTATSNNSAIIKSDNSTIVSSHNSDANPAQIDKPSSSESSPMARAIDVSELNADIEKAQKNPKNKEALAKAYFARAFALTEAAQYRAALGDFRKGLKLNPNDADAKKMHDEILRIFASINREPPKEGEEPAPLPFKSTNETTGATSSDERINFKSGATSADATGSLKNYEDSKTFVIAVKQGQTLKTEQIKDENSLQYVTFSVTDPKGETVGDSDASCNNRKEIAPTAAGDYRIEVFECKKADEWNGKFDLKVTVK